MRTKRKGSRAPFENDLTSSKVKADWTFCSVHSYREMGDLVLTAPAA